MLGLSDSVVDTSMSIGIQKAGLRYGVNGGKRDWQGYLQNALNPNFLKLLLEIRRFRAATSPEQLEENTGTLHSRRILRQNSFSIICGKLCLSTGRLRLVATARGRESLPATLYFSFFNNHKILKKPSCLALADPAWEQRRISARISA